MQNVVEDEIISIQLSEKPEIRMGGNVYIPPVQSANVLFRFFTKIDYLKDVIRYKAMVPRYYEEMIAYLKLEECKKIAFPMCCFCDIHLNKLVSHMEFYGYYGIGLNKEWGINRGIQPIQYINPNSNLINDYRVVFSKALQANDNDRIIIDDYSNYLLTSLLFMKPLEGQMFRNGKYENRNFHDEKEWRYIPDISRTQTDLPLTIPLEYMNPKAYKAYSDGIVQCQDLWLKFEYENIKYLIVKDNNDRLELIKLIRDQIETTENEKLILISKILVFNELKGDW
ncbi:hypothetical protein CPJCM30710_27790 [Clostridium polyendosporum]|uniref:Abortive phage resistance protein AbiGi, antitoxin n=1 Tax=Clostridium polyendosporum TaxID=69208 RepID=A0A919S3U8_9CLOT|nr:abortive infection system antitoxin AbiGi family protein [Clostridium polyendosporum]GIM30113.1 hypothetical protein CPJCM30710_27790 [Clostridium polyendosporum]